MLRDYLIRLWRHRACPGLEVYISDVGGCGGVTVRLVVRGGGGRRPARRFSRLAVWGTRVTLHYQTLHHILDLFETGLQAILKEI